MIISFYRLNDCISLENDLITEKIDKSTVSQNQNNLHFIYFLKYIFK